MLLKSYFTNIIFVVLFSTASAIAQDGSGNENEESIHKSWDRFEVSVGGFFSAYNSGITFRSQQLGLGLVIDVEDALGLKTTVFAMRGEATYKLGKTKKHYLTAGYFGINRTAKKNN